MKRIAGSDLYQLLVCPDCKGKIRESAGTLVCIACHQNFPRFRGAPVLLRCDNELFPSAAYDGNFVGKKAKNRKSLKTALMKAIPSKSVNLSREKILYRLSKEYKLNHKILVVGCGNQSRQLERIFQHCEIDFLFCDIDKNANADVYCDSHCLPFGECSFDGVITTAVMEHVLYPEAVISEIHKVLKDGGFIYSEIPFLQSVHEGAYDFTRFTMSGHRRLLEFFAETETGIVAGPGTALVWSIDDFFKSIFLNRKVSKLLSITSRLLFFWLKYFDYMTRNNPNAINSASCTYFLGKKNSKKRSSKNIIDSYVGTEYNHI